MEWVKCLQDSFISRSYQTLLLCAWEIYTMFLSTLFRKDVMELFASAEEFSHLLEEDTEAGAVSLGGGADFRNKDKAGTAYTWKWK